MTAQLPLPERIDLASAAELHSTLLAHMGAPLTLEGSAVRQIGTPAIQVLLAAAQTWRKTGHPLSVEAPSGQMVTQLGLAGLTLDDIASTVAE